MFQTEQNLLDPGDFNAHLLVGDQFLVLVFFFRIEIDRQGHLKIISIVRMGFDSTNLLEAVIRSGNYFTENDFS